jgi:hypothetical protein
MMNSLLRVALMGRTLNAYQRAGFETRKLYLKDLALEYDISDERMEQIVDVTGPEEDFDYLLVVLDTLSDEEDR